MLCDGYRELLFRHNNLIFELNQLACIIAITQKTPQQLRLTCPTSVHGQHSFFCTEKNQRQSQLL
jgi:hypothetical protein